MKIRFRNRFQSRNHNTSSVEYLRAQCEQGVGREIDEQAEERQYRRRCVAVEYEGPGHRGGLGGHSCGRGGLRVVDGVVEPPALSSIEYLRAQCEQGVGREIDEQAEERQYRRRRVAVEYEGPGHRGGLGGRSRGRGGLRVVDGVVQPPACRSGPIWRGECAWCLSSC